MGGIDETLLSKHYKSTLISWIDLKDTMKRIVSRRQREQELHHEQIPLFCVGHLQRTLVRGCCVRSYCWGLYQNGSQTWDGGKGSHLHRRLSARQPCTLWMLESSDGSSLVDWDSHFLAHMDTETSH